MKGLKGMMLESPISVRLLVCVSLVAFKLEATAEPQNCRTTQAGLEYMGTKTTTSNNNVCLPWTSVSWFPGTFPDGSREAAKNYCRNPNGHPDGPWCFYDINDDLGPHRAFCGIPFCPVPVKTTEAIFETTTDWKTTQAITNLICPQGYTQGHVVFGNKDFQALISDYNVDAIYVWKGPRAGGGLLENRDYLTIKMKTPGKSFIPSQLNCSISGVNSINLTIYLHSGSTNSSMINLIGSSEFKELTVDLNKDFISVDKLVFRFPDNGGATVVVKDCSMFICIPSAMENTVAISTEETTAALETTTEEVFQTTSEPYPNNTIEHINECASNPCMKPNSFCVDGYNRYFCFCNLGYTGRLCQRVIPAIVIGATCEELYPKICAAYSIRLGRPIPEENGPYLLISLLLGLYRVFCDFSMVGLQWTVIQRRTGREVNFYRSWTEYQTGFGHLSGDFWLGTDKINKLTTYYKRTTLRIELTDWTGSTCYQDYDNFSIADASDKYRIISLGNTYGTCGDSLSVNLGMQFSTYDNDNDLSANNCAQGYHGAFWYKDCGQANLNGRYVYGGGPVENCQGITWQAWKGNTYSYKSASMKIRKK